MRKLATVLVAALLMLALSMPAAAGSIYYTRKNCTVSTSIVLMKKLLRYASEDDIEAFGRLMKLYPDRIIILKPGVPVYLVDTTADGSLVKIRPRGMTVEVWTLNLMLRR